jgi:hypothetical protein
MEAVMETDTLDADQKTKFETKLTELRQWCWRGRKLWSAAYHTSQFASIALSTLAAVIPQLQGLRDPALQKNLASILAGMAALLLAISNTGAFGRKWQANRMSYSKLERLRNELIVRDATKSDVNRLNQIEEDHDKAITGG